MNILVIEDSRFLRSAIERALTHAGYSVTGVSDGEEGVREASNNPPALILLDMMLPGLDGTCVLKALKENTATARIPVIVLTGLSQRNETRLIKAGAAAYLEKSALLLEHNADGLLRVVETVLGTTPHSRGATKEKAQQGANSETNQLVPSHSENLP